MLIPQTAASEPADTIAEEPDHAPEAVAAVQLGIWISATRCVLTYVVAPALGALGLVLGPFGLLLQVLGAVTSVYGARTLWALGHRGRYLYALVALAVSGAALIALVQTLAGALR